MISGGVSSIHMHQFSSVAQLCPTLRNPMDHTTPGFHVHHELPELAQTHVHRVSDAIQTSHSPLILLFLNENKPLSKKESPSETENGQAVYECSMKIRNDVCGLRRRSKTSSVPASNLVSGCSRCTKAFIN